MYSIYLEDVFNCNKQQQSGVLKMVQNTEKHNAAIDFAELLGIENLTASPG